MMAVFKARLPFTMAALLIMTKQAVLQRNPLMQRLPTFDQNGFGPCKNLEEDQRTVIRNRYYNIMNTINLVKRIYNPSTSEQSNSDQNVTPSMSGYIFKSKSKKEAIGMNHADMPEKHLIMVRARSEIEAPQKIGRRSQVNFEPYQDQDQAQVQYQEWESKKQGREQRLVEWRKKMLRRMG